MRFLITYIFSITLLSASAQIAFDGRHNGKLSLSYGFVGENTGIAFAVDRGINDYLSSAVTLSIIGAPTDDFFSATNSSVSLRFHFIEVLNYKEPNDLYAGIDIGSSTSGIHAGYFRLLTRRFGIQVETYYGFLDSFANLFNFDTENFHKNKPRIYVGLVLNR